MESRERKARRPKSESVTPLPVEQLFLWGIVTRPQGLQGHVLVRIFSQNPAAYPLKTFWTALKAAPLAEPRAVAYAQPFSSRSPDDPKTEPFWRIRFKGIQDRDTAETLRGLHLYLPQAYLPPLPPGHFYYFEAENAQVIDRCEGPKGTLQEILPGTQYDFFIVRGPADEVYWVPAPFVESLDKTTHPPTLWVEAPPGLWDPSLSQGRP